MKTTVTGILLLAGVFVGGVADGQERLTQSFRLVVRPHAVTELIVRKDRIEMEVRSNDVIQMTVQNSVELRTQQISPTRTQSITVPLFSKDDDSKVIVTIAAF